MMLADAIILTAADASLPVSNVLSRCTLTCQVNQHRGIPCLCNSACNVDAEMVFAYRFVRLPVVCSMNGP